MMHQMPGPRAGPAAVVGTDSPLAYPPATEVNRGRFRHLYGDHGMFQGGRGGGAGPMMHGGGRPPFGAPSGAPSNLAVHTGGAAMGMGLPPQHPHAVRGMGGFSDASSGSSESAMTPSASTPGYASSGPATDKGSASDSDTGTMSMSVFGGSASESVTGVPGGGFPFQGAGGGDGSGAWHDPAAAAAGGPAGFGAYGGGQYAGGHGYDGRSGHGYEGGGGFTGHDGGAGPYGMHAGGGGGGRRRSGRAQQQQGYGPGPYGGGGGGPYFGGGEYFAGGPPPGYGGPTPGYGMMGGPGGRFPGPGGPGFGGMLLPDGPYGMSMARGGYMPQQPMGPGAMYGGGGGRGGMRSGGGGGRGRFRGGGGFDGGFGGGGGPRHMGEREPPRILSRFRTKLCSYFMDSNGAFCPHGAVCQFAHGIGELRVPGRPGEPSMPAPPEVIAEVQAAFETQGSSGVSSLTGDATGARGSSGGGGHGGGIASWLSGPVSGAMPMPMPMHGQTMGPQPGAVPPHYMMGEAGGFRGGLSHEGGPGDHMAAAAAAGEGAFYTHLGSGMGEMADGSSGFPHHGGAPPAGSGSSPIYSIPPQNVPTGGPHGMQFGQQFAGGVSHPAETHKQHPGAGPAAGSGSQSGSSPHQSAAGGSGSPSASTFSLAGLRAALPPLEAPAAGSHREGGESERSASRLGAAALGRAAVASDSVAGSSSASGSPTHGLSVHGSVAFDDAAPTQSGVHDASRR